MKPIDAVAARARTHQWLLDNPMTPEDDPGIYLQKLMAVAAANEADALGPLAPSRVPGPTHLPPRAVAE